MTRSSSTGLPFLIRRTDTGKFCYHRELPAHVASFVTGEVATPWSRGTHALEGRAAVKVSLKTGDDATARVRWNRVHEQVEGFVQMGHVLAAEKEQRRRERAAVERLPSGCVATIAAQARHDLLAEHDRTWIDPTFTSPMTGVVVELMRKASRAASPDRIEEARQFTDALRGREARAALASRTPGMVGLEIEEGEITDPGLIAAIDDLAAGRIDRLTPEHNAALGAVPITATVPSEIDRRLQENGFALPQGHPERRALALALLRTAVSALETVAARDGGAAIDTPERPPVIAPVQPPPPKPKISAMRAQWIKDERPKQKQIDDNALYVGYFVGEFGDLSVDQITKPMLAEFRDRLLRCPRNVPHAIRRASLKERIAWGEKPANLKQPRLSRITINAKGLGSISAVLTTAETLGHIAINPCVRMGLKIEDGDAGIREPYSLSDLTRIFASSIYAQPVKIPISGCGLAAHWMPLIAPFAGARLEEIGQLLVSDIKLVEGTWCIHVTDTPDEDDEADRTSWWNETAPTKAVKTAAARRLVPIHPELIRCGFLDFVERRRKEGFTRLFPELKSYRGRTTKEWSKFWARFTDRHVTNSPSKTFHSFRHLFVERLRAAKVDENVIKALVGHANKDVTAGYGKINGATYPMLVLKEAIEKIRISGLDLSRFYP